MDLLICLSYLLCCDVICLTSIKVVQTFHLLLGFAENQWYVFYIQNRVQIINGLDNGDLDSQGPTVCT